MPRPIRMAFLVANSFAGAKIMFEAAQDEAEQMGLQVVLTSEVPTCFEMPLPLQNILQREDIDMVVVLGSLFPESAKAAESNSPWLRSMLKTTLNRLDRLSLKYDKPVVKELLDPGMVASALPERIEKQARQAVRNVADLRNEIARIYNLPSAIPEREWLLLLEEAGAFDTSDDDEKKQF